MSTFHVDKTFAEKPFRWSADSFAENVFEDALERFAYESAGE
jgi:hypothetical protein